MTLIALIALWWLALIGFFAAMRCSVPYRQFGFWQGTPAAPQLSWSKGLVWVDLADQSLATRACVITPVIGKSRRPEHERALTTCRCG